MKTEEELVDALLEDRDTIHIEATLSRKVANIKNTGKIAWGVLIGGVIMATTTIVSSKAFKKKNHVILASTISTIPSISIAILYIGLPSTLSLIKILVYAYQKNNKSINEALNVVLRLRNNYYIAEADFEKYILKKVVDNDDIPKSVKVDKIIKE